MLPSAALGVVLLLWQGALALHLPATKHMTDDQRLLHRHRVLVSDESEAFGALRGFAHDLEVLHGAVLAEMLAQIIICHIPLQHVIKHLTR